ncbi:mRNA turnover protein 4 homolog [Trichonephila inaurata madagascariensis]|uniref:Ribosome assembly factor mrt4 n=1 Tax=Trichonephila inaurata madagascariensis TaxID=2747483 RepID=A0A8X6XQV9_9ARAC|nr:mRNA turnover protein 4 homolog [Trichonephila inaurata madagascariensis]
MPRSKRNKQMDLTDTKDQFRERKKEFYQKIQSCVKNYAHVFVFAANDRRNTKLRNVRMQWKTSWICVGKNKVMAKTLGLTEKDEFRPNLHKIGQQLKGDRGLLFTNQPIEEVVNWFSSYSEGEYARSGNIATEDVILQKGPLKQFPNKLEPYLKQLGLSTTLKEGVIYLLEDYVVCRVGDALSPESAKILKLLGKKMAEFKIKLLSVWSNNGNFVDLDSKRKKTKKDKQRPVT